MQNTVVLSQCGFLLPSLTVQSTYFLLPTNILSFLGNSLTRTLTLWWDVGQEHTDKHMAFCTDKWSLFNLGRCISAKGKCYLYFTIVIKAMRDLMSDDHADGPIVQGVGLPGTKERGLQNASREDWRRENSGRFGKIIRGFVNDSVIITNLFLLCPVHLG